MRRLNISPEGLGVATFALASGLCLRAVGLLAGFVVVCFAWLLGVFWDRWGWRWVEDHKDADR